MFIFCVFSSILLTGGGLGLAKSAIRASRILIKAWNIDAAVTGSWGGSLAKSIGAAGTESWIGFPEASRLMPDALRERGLDVEGAPDLDALWFFSSANRSHSV